MSEYEADIPDDTFDDEEAPEQAQGQETLSNEAAYWRRQAQKHQRDLAKLKAAPSEEVLGYQAEIAEARGRLEKMQADHRAALVYETFASAAAKAGCHDTDVAALAVDLSKLTVTDAGQVLGVESLVAGLKKAKSYLFVSPSNGKSPPVFRSGLGTVTTVQSLKSFDSTIRAALRNKPKED